MALSSGTRLGPYEVVRAIGPNIATIYGVERSASGGRALAMELGGLRLQVLGFGLWASGSGLPASGLSSQSPKPRAQNRRAIPLSEALSIARQIDHPSGFVMRRRVSCGPLRDEVYVREFPGGQAKQQVSVSGGTLPKWSAR